MVSINALSEVEGWLPWDRQQLQEAQETYKVPRNVRGWLARAKLPMWAEVSGEWPETKVYWRRTRA